jgi:carboxypeptidase Taq
MSTTALYNQYKERLQQIAHLRHALALLQWDQETYLPAQAHETRARQIATLSQLAHNQFTGSELGQLLQNLQGRNGLTEAQQQNVALSWYDYTQAQKLPAAFVHRMAQATSTAFYNWTQARAQNNFSLFQPHLQQLVQLKKEEAGLLGYEAHPYNALLNQHDKGSTVAQLDEVLGGLAAPLRQLLQRIEGKPQVNNGFLTRHYAKETQWSFGKAGKMFRPTPLPLALAVPMCA